MTKAEVVQQIASQAGLTKADAEKSLNAFIGVVTTSLKKGEDVALIGFGTYTTVKRAARSGRNPATGKAIKIAATTAVKFKVGKKLKDAVA
ncbi:MAG: HU family DNA-binding protein [Chlorobiaceae bacterium]